MQAKQSRRLVVDASVAQSAGETENPVSRCCREVLTEILRICHRVVMTDEILEEWKSHQSKFFLRWRSSMFARRKILKCQGREIGSIEGCGFMEEREKNAFEKDLHLVKAACAGDVIIVTRDEKFRAMWNKHGRSFTVARPIRWINPVTDGARVLDKL